MGGIRRGLCRTVFAAALLLALSGAANAERLIPGGQLVGVAVRSDGLVYVGATDLKKLPSPARLAGLKSGDIIRTVDGQTVSDTQSLGERLAAGKAVKLGVRRGERELTFDVQPQRDERDGVYRIGAWVREGAAGIGTLTYVDPETGVYGALGHPINDSDSGVSIPVREGVLYEGELTGVVRGRRGVPGALEGEIVEQAPLGTIEWNDDTGIGGVFVRAAAGSALFPDGIETESANRVKTGRGQLIATVDENGPKLYDIDILRVDANADTRTFQIRVTDEALLKITGGIVQGMSGSPVIQNGKLIGAVTHVLVDDPTRGFAVGIERMLETAKAEAASKRNGRGPAASSRMAYAATIRKNLMMKMVEMSFNLISFTY